MSFTITAEKLAEDSVAAITARAEELGTPLSDGDKAGLIGFMSSAGVELPESQAAYDEKMEEVKNMPAEGLAQMLGIVKMMSGIGGDVQLEDPWSITAEELSSKSVDAISVRAEELGTPLSDEDKSGLVNFMANAGIELPETEAAYDEKMAETAAMDAEGLAQLLGIVKMMSGMDGGEVEMEDSWSITASELAVKSVAALVARAEELGAPLSAADQAGITSFLANAEIELPETEAAFDAKMAETAAMDKDGLAQMLGIVKFMSGDVGEVEDPFSITNQELADKSLEALTARAKELGAPLTSKDKKDIAQFFANAEVELPETQAAYDEKMADIKGMDKEGLAGMLGIVKMMTGADTSEVEVEEAPRSSGGCCVIA
jgi:glutathione synthase/RimK-type ligase-like ATP-grasp enzyme